MDRAAWWLAVFPVAALACGGSSKSAADRSGPDSGGTASGRGGSGAGGSSAGTAGSDAGDAGEASGGSAGNGGSSGQPSSSVSLDGDPIYTRVQRLTVTQWKNAVTDILRLEHQGRLGVDFAAPPSGTEFTNNEKVLFVNVREALDFESGSEEAAALATGSEAALSRLHPDTDRAGFVSALGRRAFRRPLSADEQAKYEGVFALGEELYGAGFPNGAALVIRALLVSPHFLYRTELGPAGEPLNGYEAASKLSFWLLGTTPSDALLDSAAAGELDSADGLEREARAMLERAGAVAVARDFHAQAFRTSRFAQLTKVNTPEFDESVSAEAAEASSLFFDSVFEGDEGLREILTSSRAFVGPSLAPFYGIAPPASVEELTLDDARAGFFLQVPFLQLFSSDEQPGTLVRGAVLNAEVLCNDLPPEGSEIPPQTQPHPEQTNRERLEQLTANCGDCHQAFINPLGFAFEAFDGLGRRRELDNGRPIDTSGRYPFSNGTESFADARELVQIMADGAQAHTCYAKKVTSYALQRDMVEDDRPLLESLSEVSREASMRELVIALVRAPAFRVRAEGLP